MTDRLAPGDLAPDFTLTSDGGDQVSLADLRGRKVIVYFYPAAMTPGCTTQACDFTESLDSLRWGGYEVHYLLGVSYDDRYSLTGRASAEDLRDAAELSQRVRSWQPPAWDFDGRRFKCDLSFGRLASLGGAGTTRWYGREWGLVIPRQADASS